MRAFRHVSWVVALFGGSLALPGVAQDRREVFAAPFAVVADGVPIDVPADRANRLWSDNSYPWFADFDGDGKPDLLVGQYGDFRPGKLAGEGRLRIYRNLGAPGRPRFGAPAWFDDAVPTGRIPKG